MFVVPIQTYILIYKKIYEHWGVAGTLPPTQKIPGSTPDPLSIRLHILYIEPLITSIDMRVIGIRFHNFHQSAEDFCDDLSLVT